MILRNDIGLVAARARRALAGRLARRERVAQHRFFRWLLVIAFGIFEWMVRSGRPGVAARGPDLPASSACRGAACSLSHSHRLPEPQGQFPARGDAQPPPLGLPGLAGRLGAPGSRCGWPEGIGGARAPGRLWAWGLVLIGAHPQSSTGRASSRGLARAQALTLRAGGRRGGAGALPGNTLSRVPPPRAVSIPGPRGHRASRPPFDEPAEDTVPGRAPPPAPPSPPPRSAVTVAQSRFQDLPRQRSARVCFECKT